MAGAATAASRSAKARSVISRVVEQVKETAQSILPGGGDNESSGNGNGSNDSSI